MISKISKTGMTSRISEDGVSGSARFTSLSHERSIAHLPCVISVRGIKIIESLASDGPDYSWCMYCILLCVPHISIARHT